MGATCWQHAEGPQDYGVASLMAGGLLAIIGILAGH